MRLTQLRYAGASRARLPVFLALGLVALGIRFAAAAPAANDPAAVTTTSHPPLKGSQIPEHLNMCAKCHTQRELWNQDDPARRRLYVNKDALQNDVHFLVGVSCVDCHGGNHQDLGRAHTAGFNFRSKRADIQKYCNACHEKAIAPLAGSVHATADCIRCHAAPDAEGKSSPHAIVRARQRLSNQAAFCGSCHTKEAGELRNNSVHSLAGGQDSGNMPLPLACTECHRTSAHTMQPIERQGVSTGVRRKSFELLNEQIAICGRCHADKLETFRRSIHGKGLEKSGLSGVPGCVECHGAHAIYHPTDERSSLSAANVADTCAACHQGLKEILAKSVHGRGDGLGHLADRPAPGGTTRQKPSCTSCHRGHALLATETSAFRKTVPDSCGNCHGKMSTLYGRSIHGRLTDLGYSPAAKCADCHGHHDIRPLDDPESRLSLANRVQTCGQCHPNPSANFVKFNPHIDPTDAKHNPLVYAVQNTLYVLLFSTFGFFGLHSVLWFLRGLVEVFWHGRPRGLRPGAVAYVRFISYHRIGHTIMMVSFLGLALTGMPLKYHHAAWAKTLAATLGGFGSTSFWHRFFGVILLVTMLAYLARMTRLLIVGRKQGRTLAAMIFGPDSSLPNLRDVKDFLKMARWFFGLGPKPSYDRWTYWEKIDFWGAIADTVIIGTTGLVLWFPSVFCGPLPFTTLHVSQVVHSTQALLATGFVFAIHFFNTHLRPDKFPADMSVLTGLVSEEEFEEERPDQYQRLQREGRLEELRREPPTQFSLWCIRLFGLLALSVGLALLVGMIAAAMN